MECICGFVNADDAKVCDSCGSSLALHGVAPEPPKVAASAESVSLHIEIPNARPRRLPGRRIVVALITAAVVLGSSYWRSHSSGGRAGPRPSGLFAINIDGKRGFMDSVGKIVIPAQFDGVSSFSEGFAAVKVGSKHGFIDTTGALVITPQFDEARSFSEGFASVRLGSKFGYIDRKGLVVITPQFDGVNDFHDGRAAVKLCCGSVWNGAETKKGSLGDSRYAFIDKKGKHIGPPTFLFVSPDWGQTPGWIGEATVVRTVEDQIGVLSSDGGIRIVDQADEVRFGDGFTGGLAPVGRGGKWGYIDTKGGWKIEPQFEQASGFRDGLASVQVGRRWGLIDKKGKFVVNPQYSGLFGLSEGLAVIEAGEGTIPGCSSCGRYGFINTTGQMIVEPVYTQHPDREGGLRSPVGFFSDGFAAVKTDKGGGSLIGRERWQSSRNSMILTVSTRAWPGSRSSGRKHI